jgi:hypothetical protein
MCAVAGSSRNANHHTTEGCLIADLIFVQDGSVVTLSGFWIATHHGSIILLVQAGVGKSPTAVKCGEVLTPLLPPVLAPSAKAISYQYSPKQIKKEFEEEMKSEYLRGN